MDDRTFVGRRRQLEPNACISMSLIGPISTIFRHQLRHCETIISCFSGCGPIRLPNRSLALRVRACASRKAISVACIVVTASLHRLYVSAKMREAVSNSSMAVVISGNGIGIIYLGVNRKSMDHLITSSATQLAFNSPLEPCFESSEHSVRIGAGDVEADPRGRILRIPD
jgi:hypothetical protein